MILLVTLMSLHVLLEDVSSGCADQEIRGTRDFILHAQSPLFYVFYLN